VAHHVLTGFARRFNLLSLPKTGYQLGLTSVLLLAGIGSVHDASALNETRTLSFHHTHSGEDLTVTFKRDGRYDEEALKQLNHFLRDWRTQEQTTMDRHLFDIIWEAYRDVDGKKPIQIISAYRSPETNAMLRRRSAHTGVARFSQHMLGHAMDFYIPDVPLEQIRFAGLRLQRGGVGFYPTSGSPFVHLDTGGIRHWPRMTHDQLVRVFPDGRTVHVPSDGTPLKGYELARADIERRGNGDDAATIAKPPNLLARLFGNKSNDDEDEGAAPAVQAKPVPTVQVAAARSAAPRARPAGATLQLAAADVQVVQPARPKPPAAPDRAEAKPQTPADIINARGFWDDMPAAPNQATPAQIAAINARKALASTDPQSTSSVQAAYQAMAYAPEASAPVDHAHIDHTHVVAASAPIPHSARPANRNSMVANDVTTVVAKGQSRAQDGVVANATRIVASQTTDVWMRLMMLAPSASTSMSVTMLGDANMTLLSKLFVKPQATIVMGFSGDPMMGLTTDRFSGPAMAPLTTQSFGLRTASLY
jgi:uncharacterized protein YcbK (DUF882 family)